jgi:hypothetical protein
MGKEKVALIGGLPSKTRNTFIEISGKPKVTEIKNLYRRVAFRLPVYLN